MFKKRYREKLLDSKYSLPIHRQIIEGNQLLNSVYKDFYTRIKKELDLKPIVEIGSGAGFIKRIIPQTITTDLIKAEEIDLVTSAYKLPFKNESIGSIVMLNVFHHIKRPTLALKEFTRCLKRTGKIVMIEPCASPWAKFIYRFFHHERFDTSSGWVIKGRGRLSDANGAIPWIIFIRDRNRLHKQFPNLKIQKIEYHTPIAYLLSGGLSRFQIFKKVKYKRIKQIEKRLEKFAHLFSLFMTIVIEKV